MSQVYVESPGCALCLRTCTSYRTHRSGHEKNGKYLEVWLLGKLLKNLQQNKVVNCLTGGYALRFFIYINHGPMQNVRRKIVQKHVTHTVEAKTLQKRLKSFFGHWGLGLLFDIAHDQATSLISYDSCQTESMIAQNLKFLEDQRYVRKLELCDLEKKCCRRVIRKPCLQRDVREHCRLTKTQTIN